MNLPLVALVGRPNVGKSTLFNHLIGTRLSIVDDEPGITRDRIYAKTSWGGRDFTLIDTGGIEPVSEDLILKAMREQAQTAIDMAHVIVFLTDSQSGLTATDEDVGLMLRRSGKPVLVAVNKVDNPGSFSDKTFEFYKLGFDGIAPISAEHGLGIGDLLDEIIALLPQEQEGLPDEDIISVAFIGKPNAGKSSTVNKILGEDRAIVTDIPGTTRDSIDSYFENEYGKFNIIDTAGLRRRGKIEPGVEKYSAIRTRAAIERSDVCVIIIDAVEGVTKQDTAVAGYAHNAGKACILAVNKWDLVEKDSKTQKTFELQVRNAFAYMSYAPLVFISAKTGQNFNLMMEHIVAVDAEAKKRLTTGALNDLLTQAVAMVPTPQDKGRHLKIYYGTQTGVKPPTFVLFINDKNLMHFSYMRYLENRLRELYGFEGTPIRIFLRPKKEDS